MFYARVRQDPFFGKTRLTKSVVSEKKGTRVSFEIGKLYVPLQFDGFVS